jgi:hypothetical protein
MGSDTTIAVGPKGEDDYRKLFVDSSGRLKSVTEIKGLSVAAKITIVSLTSTQWTALPSSPLAGRSSVCIQNQSGTTEAMFINYSASAPAEGIRIEDGGFRALSIADGVTLYGRMVNGNGSVAVEELA